MKVPRSLTTKRSIDGFESPPGTVRPAQLSRLERLPWTGMSASEIPLGPQAAQQTSASSSSERATGSCAEEKESGPFACLTSLPLDHSSSSSSPLSQR